MCSLACNTYIFKISLNIFETESTSLAGYEIISNRNNIDKVDAACSLCVLCIFQKIQVFKNARRQQQTERR